MHPVIIFMGIWVKNQMKSRNNMNQKERDGETRLLKGNLNLPKRRTIWGLKMLDSEAARIVKDILESKDSYDFYSDSSRNHISDFERGQIDILKKGFNIDYEIILSTVIRLMGPKNRLSPAWKHIAEVIERELDSLIVKTTSEVKDER